MKDNPLLLDTYCGAGGMTRGYQQAGFRVVGVDKFPQKRYIGDDFLQADALETLETLVSGGYITAQSGERYCLADFAAVSGSPPCQRDSVMTNGRWKDRVQAHPDLIAPTREAFLKTGLPYVIENVGGARRKLITPVMLCGTMFGLETSGGSQLQRHRYFECPSLAILTPPCRHNKGSAIGVYGGGQHPARRVPATIGVWGHAGRSSARDGLIQFGTQDRREAMGIEWMVGDELSEAIPPAYARFIGEFLMKHLTATRAAPV